MQAGEIAYMSRRKKQKQATAPKQAGNVEASPDGEAEPRAKIPFLRRRAVTIFLCLHTTPLLIACFAPADAWWLGYAALVPWVLGVALAPTRRWGLFAGWLGGLVFWGCILYWLTWITMVGYIAGILYLSLYWLVAGAILRAAVRRNQPMWIVLPLVWVSLEFIRGAAQTFYLGPSFPWFALAYGQYTRTALIQIADVTGIYGVSFVVAMANGLLVDASLWGVAWRRRSCAAALASPISMPIGGAGWRLVVGSVAFAASLAGVLGYGAWQLSRDTRQVGPVVGIVQRAYPISLGGRGVEAEEILDRHLADTASFLGAQVKPDLVIWPETMLPTALNREILDLDINSLEGDYLRCLAAKFDRGAWDTQFGEDLLRDYLRRVLQADQGDTLSKRRLAGKVLDMSGQLGCPILAGGITIYRNAEPLFHKDEWLVRNGALWFDPNDPNAPSYAKRHLVPFSEYVPFKHSWLGLHKLLRKCVPDVMEQIDPGPTRTRFVLSRPRGRWRVVSPICYEGTMPEVCREMVYQDGQKKADILANLSNDGWFVKPTKSAAPRASTEQSQHLSHYCFRAVENRVPVVRAVNTGVSASIDSNGRIVAEVRRGGRNTMISGTLLLDGAWDGKLEYLPGHGPKVLVDERTSWYSRVGDAFAVAVLVAAVAWVVVIFARRGRDKKGMCN